MIENAREVDRNLVQKPTSNLINQTETPQRLHPHYLEAFTYSITIARILFI